VSLSAEVSASVTPAVVAHSASSSVELIITPPTLKVPAATASSVVKVAKHVHAHALFKPLQLFAAGR
jgi:hypothetical protein